MRLNVMRDRRAPFIAEKVDTLFRQIRAPSGAEFTPEEVQAGTGIHASYIRRLRNGKVANPGRDTLAALSAFFNVDPTYWFQTEHQISKHASTTTQLGVLHRKLDEAEAQLTPEQAGFLTQMVTQLLDGIRRLTDAEELDQPKPSDSEEGHR